MNPNQPPSVSITNPVNNATFIAPATFTLQATAPDSDGSVSQVQSFNGATSLGVITSAPYSVTVSSLSAGNYTLSAVASDNLGAKATNSISITVTNPPPSAVTLLNPTSGGANDFTAHGVFATVSLVWY